MTNNKRLKEKEFKIKRLLGIKEYLIHTKITKGTRCKNCGLAQNYWNQFSCLERLNE